MLESYKNRTSREISKAKTRQEFRSQYFPYWSQHRIIQKAHVQEPCNYITWQYDSSAFESNIPFPYLGFDKTIQKVEGFQVIGNRWKVIDACVIFSFSGSHMQSQVAIFLWGGWWFQ